MSMTVEDINKLLEGLPPGAWVAISTEQERVLAYGDNAEAVIDEARRMGVPGPFIGRVPEAESLMFY